jgi:hypothetical protein
VLAKRVARVLGGSYIIHVFLYWSKMYRGADKSLSRQGRKQATATKLSLLQATKKKKSESCPSNQVSAAAMTSASDEKWRPFNCFCRVGLKTYQHPYTVNWVVSLMFLIVSSGNIGKCRLVVTWLFHDRFLPNPLRYITHFMILHYIFWICASVVE